MARLSKDNGETEQRQWRDLAKRQWRDWSYAVTSRTREIGIRMALGARAVSVLSLVIKDGMKWALAGLAIGISGAVALTRLMRTLLFDVTPTDPATFARGCDSVVCRSPVRVLPPGPSCEWIRSDRRLAAH